MDMMLFGLIPKARKHAEVHRLNGFGVVKFHVKIKKHFEAPHTWVIKAEVVSKNGKQLASSESKLFLRDRMRDNFHHYMDIPDEETRKFGTYIFTAQGIIRPELLTNPVQKGSGVWGTEIDKGCLALVDTICVAQEHRRKGLGRWMLTQTLKIPEIAVNCKFVFAWPAALNSDCTSEGASRSALVLAFFHRAGFRRVGRTCFLGIALGKTPHPSQKLGIEEDPPELGKDKDNNELDSPELSAARDPLHYAIVNSTDDELVDVINTAINTNASALTKCWLGDTLLHTAAFMGKVQAVRLLVAAIPQALEALNDDGYTPLESLQATLLHGREYFNAMVAPRLSWPGIEKNYCQILLELSKAARKPFPRIDPVSREPWTAFQWGCTCGQCIEGWMSPHMKAQIHGLAEVAVDNFADCDFLPRTIIKEDDYVPMSDGIPSAIRKAGIYPTYVKGYSLVFEAIARVFAGRSRVTPSIAAIAEELVANSFMDDNKIEYYFSNGGKIEHALREVLNLSAQMSVTDMNEYHYESMCANDYAFELVRIKLGLEALDNYALPELEGSEDMSDSNAEDIDEDVNCDEVVKTMRKKIRMMIAKNKV